MNFPGGPMLLCTDFCIYHYILCFHFREVSKKLNNIMVRKKSRYLVAKIQYNDNKIDLNLDADTIKNAIRNTINELFGEYGMAAYAQGIFVKYCNPYTGIFFLRVDRDHHCHIRTCVSFVKMLRQRLCVLSCIHVTGTLKSAERFLLDYNTKEMQVMYDRCKTPIEKQKIKNIIDGLGMSSIIDDSVAEE